VTRKQLQRLMTETGDKLTSGEFEQMLKDLKLDNSTTINYAGL